MKILTPSFGNTKYTSREGEGVTVISLDLVDEQNVREYAESLLSSGYTKRGERTLGGNTFMSFSQGEDAVFVSFFPTTGEALVVFEENSNFFDFSAPSGESVTTPAICQIHVSDYGMSYAIRLSDGSFILIDGARDDERDADALYSRLVDMSEGREIRVAAWIMTHPHLDHYRVFFTFMRKYSSSVKVERMLFNFPPADDETAALLPELAVGNIYAEREYMPRFVADVEARKIPAYRPHTGQVYDVGDARIEFLGSPDENFTVPVGNINNISLVFRITLGGNTILITGDYQFYIGRFTERWGEYLRSDIHQISHHVFHGETCELIRLVSAPTNLLTSFEDDVFAKIGIRYDYFHLLLELPSTLEVYTGAPGGTEPAPEHDVLLTLPHTPKAEGRAAIAELMKKYSVTRDSIKHRF